MDEQRGLEYLNAPWRMAYIEQADTPRGGCIFCDKPCQTPDCDRENYIVHRGTSCFVILNAFPYNNGHLMVIPYRHTAELSDLTAEEQQELLHVSTLAMAALRRVMHPDGFNLGMNLGRAGGAGIAEHLHLHVVPRWVGDTNFMTTVAGARVLPESLTRTWEKLTHAFAEVVSGANA